MCWALRSEVEFLWELLLGWERRIWELLGHGVGWNRCRFRLELKRLGKIRFLLLLQVLMAQSLLRRWILSKWRRKWVRSRVVGVPQRYLLLKWRSNLSDFLLLRKLDDLSLLLSKVHIWELLQNLSLFLGILVDLSSLDLLLLNWVSLEVRATKIECVVFPRPLRSLFALDFLWVDFFDDLERSWFFESWDEWYCWFKPDFFGRDEIEFLRSVFLDLLSLSRAPKVRQILIKSLPIVPIRAPLAPLFLRNLRHALWKQRKRGLVWQIDDGPL